MISPSPTGDDHVEPNPDHKDNKEQFGLLRGNGVGGTDTHLGKRNTCCHKDAPVHTINVPKRIRRQAGDVRPLTI